MIADLVIFDCDGVLVDSEPLVNAVYVNMLHERGMFLDADESLREFSGASMSTRLAAFSSRFAWLPEAGFERDFDSRLTDLMRTELKVVEGVREVLEALTVPICVASNGTSAEIRTRLEMTGLLSAFRGSIFSAVEVGLPKPASDIYLFAAGRMNVAPERCVIVEDSVPGVLAAVAAGMSVFGYAKLTDPAVLLAAGAATITSMAELAEVFRDPRRGLCRTGTCR